jgi:3-hydroxybutyryl-CoA dehydrogenase
MEIKSVFVAGAGFMGNGIAEMAAVAGYRVIMCDVGADRLESGMKEIGSSLVKLLSKDKITGAQYDAALGNLTTSTTLEDAAGTDLVVEAIPEKLESKKEMFAKLDELCPERTILATNTSAISISSIASATGRPDKVVGTHFFGPVPVMRLCEIIGGLLTSEETLRTADEWARSVGKETVLVRRDHAGFIANRINIPGSLEAVRMVEAGSATPEEIDRAATFGAEQAVGPMQIMDNAGIDVSFNATMAIYEDTGDPRFFPPPLMRRMIAANLLGRKTARGFYDYSSGQKAVYEVAGAGKRDEDKLNGSEEQAGMIMKRILVPIILESIRMVETGVAVPADIDKASRLGFNFPMGPLELADSMGLDDVLSWSSEIYEETGNFNYFPPALLKRMVRREALGRKSGKGFYQY